MHCDPSVRTRNTTTACLVPRDEEQRFAEAFNDLEKSLNDGVGKDLDIYRERTRVRLPGQMRIRGGKALSSQPMVNGPGPGKTEMKRAEEEAKQGGRDNVFGGHVTRMEYRWTAKSHGTALCLRRLPTSPREELHQDRLEHPESLIRPRSGSQSGLAVARNRFRSSCRQPTSKNFRLRWLGHAHDRHSTGSRIMSIGIRVGDASLFDGARRHDRLVPAESDLRSQNRPGGAWACCCRLAALAAGSDELASRSGWCLLWNADRHHDVDHLWLL